MPLDDVIPGNYLSNRFQIQPSPTHIPDGELRAYLFHHEPCSGNIGIMETIILAAHIEKAKQCYVQFRKENEKDTNFFAQIEIIEEKRLYPGILAHISYID